MQNFATLRWIARIAFLKAEKTRAILQGKQGMRLILGERIKWLVTC